MGEGGDGVNGGLRRRDIWDDGACPHGRDA